MSAAEPQARFEELVMPHLDAAYNLARWLTGNDHDAKDIAQEACLRAFRFQDGFRGGNSRSWLLTSVRNTAYTWLKQNRPQSLVSLPHDELLEASDVALLANPAPDSNHADRDVLKAALEKLPVEFSRGAYPPRIGRTFL